MAAKTSRVGSGRLKTMSRIVLRINFYRRARPGRRTAHAPNAGPHGWCGGKESGSTPQALTAWRRAVDAEWPSCDVQVSRPANVKVRAMKNPVPKRQVVHRKPRCRILLQGCELAPVPCAHPESGDGIDDVKNKILPVNRSQAQVREARIMAMEHCRNLREGKGVDRNAPAGAP